MVERDWSEWLDVIDSNSGEVLFACVHCGTGDHGWDFWASSSVNQFHASNLEELFKAASWVMRAHIKCAEVMGYWKPEFMAWWNENKED